jgi:hypothetical protein
MGAGAAGGHVFRTSIDVEGYSRLACRPQRLPKESTHSQVPLLKEGLIDRYRSSESWVVLEPEWFVREQLP